MKILISISTKYAHRWRMIKTKRKNKPKLRYVPKKRIPKYGYYTDTDSIQEHTMNEKEINYKKIKNY